jgi:hypothetical protein
VIFFFDIYIYIYVGSVNKNDAVLNLVSLRSLDYIIFFNYHLKIISHCIYLHFFFFL